MNYHDSRHSASDKSGEDGGELVVINKIVCQLQPLTLFDAFHLFEIVSVPGTYIGCWQRARPAEFAGATIT